jgi:hypothetical protein
MQPHYTSLSHTDSHWGRERFERDARSEKREVEAIERGLVAEFDRRAECARREDRELRREERELRRDEHEQATLGRELDRDVAVKVADATLIATEAQRSKREERQEERQIESGSAAAMAEEIRLERELLAVDRELAHDAATFESQYLLKEAAIKRVRAEMAVLK